MKSKLPAEVVSNHLHGLQSTKGNNQMMVDKIRHEGTAEKSVSFFKQLPPEVLTEVRDLSKDAQEAYDQEFGLMTYSPIK